MIRFLALLLASLGSGCLLITSFADIRFGECGDGAVFLETEECDDGNSINGDGCSADCQLEFCGDATLNAGETCDDGNNTNGDGCDDVCQVEVGFVCNGEPSICASTCGDGIEASDEICDDGNTINGDGCNNNCQLDDCGDGFVVGAEICDDGNNISGDGCNTGCAIEGGFNCIGEPSVCTPI